MKPAGSFSYRPEIDGLRAIAVVSVVLYHANLGVPGGFVGVDVFFVISGFLITSLILRDLLENRFRLADFWERRARRILPALLPATLAALVLSIIFLTPSALETAAKSAIWLSGFASNVFFCRTISYFSPSAEGQPLLHTWSLAVEEQFYLLFPPMLMGGFALVHRSRRGLFAFVLVLAGLSLAVSLRETNANPTYAFYLLHTRAFELLLGALIAFVPGSAVERWRRWREFASVGGLALIGWACFHFTKNTPFPGYHSLVPCGGAALYIVGNIGERAPDARPVTWSGRALAWRPIVFVGLVSYSFYLWHWPPLAILNYWHIALKAPIVRIVIVLITFVCAVLSWRFIERPFRQTRAPARRFAVFAGAVLSMGCLMGVGVAMTKTGVTLSRVPAAAIAWIGGGIEAKYTGSTDSYHVRNNKLPLMGVDDPNVPVTVLVWGDSHGMAVGGIIDEVLREKGRKGYAAVHASTAPLLGFYSWGNYALNDQSIHYANAVMEMIKREKIRDVILIAYWNSYFEEYPSGTLHDYKYDPFSKALIHTIQELQALGVRVIFQRQAPNYVVNVQEELAWRTMWGKASHTGELHFEELRYPCPQWDALERDIIAMNVTVIDTVALLSNAQGIPLVALDGKSWYIDGHHLSVAGARRLESAYRALFAESAPQ